MKNLLSEWRQEYIKTIPQDIATLISLATYDLYYGPITEERKEEYNYIYSSFEDACNKITEHLKSTLNSVYVRYNDPSFFQTERPEEDEFVEFEVKHLIEEIVGKELYKYLL